MRNKLRKRQYENEVLRLVDVDVARAAGTAPVAVAVHIASAWEIATEMQLAVGVGARRPPLMRRAPPRRESAPYFVGPRCVFVCVCVCVCVFVCVLSSRCLVCRPSYLCVCRFAAPLRRVNKYNSSVRTSGRGDSGLLPAGATESPFLHWRS